MKNVNFGIFCCLASLAVAAAATRHSSNFRQDANNLGYVRLVSRTDSRSSSPGKSGSSQMSGSPLARSPTSGETSTASSSRRKSPVGRDSTGIKSSPQVIRRPFAVRPIDDSLSIPDSSSTQRQTTATGGGRLASSSSSSSFRERNGSFQSKQPSVLNSKVESKRQHRSQSKQSDGLGHIDDPVQLHGITKGRYSALTIANGPAHLQVGVLGKPPTTRLVRPGRTGILSVNHDTDTVWATGSAADGGSASAHAIGDGVAASVLAGYTGKGYIKTFGSDGHETHTEVHPGKNEDEQWESLDPQRATMAASVGIHGPGQATAGGLGPKHISPGKKASSAPRS